MSENIDNMQEAIRQINICNKAVRLYEAAKIIVDDDVEITIPEAKIALLKAKFAAARTACKNALNSITA